jgi:hypothetical protein
MNKFLFSKLLLLLFAVLVSSCDNAYIKSWYEDELNNAKSPDVEVPVVKIPYVEVGEDTCDIVLYYFTTTPPSIGTPDGGSGSLEDRAVIYITYPNGTGSPPGSPPGDGNIEIVHSGKTVEPTMSVWTWRPDEGNYACDYTVTAANGKQKYYQVIAKEDPPEEEVLENTCDILLYYFTKHYSYGIIGSGTGIESDPVLINITYPYEGSVPENDDPDIKIVHSGKSVESEDGWTEQDGVYVRDYTVTAADDTTKKYYRVIAKEGIETSIPNAVARVIVFNYPSEYYSSKPTYDAELYGGGELTAATFTSPSAALNFTYLTDNAAQSMGTIVEVVLKGGSTPGDGEYVLLLKNVGYFNGVKFTDGIALVSWTDMWHTFVNETDFKNFMNNPYLPSNDYRIALSTISMEDLSAGKDTHLYGLMKSPYTYRFDFRGCTGTSFISTVNHQNPTRINEVYLNPDLQTVGDYAFDGCTNLSKIELPSGVTTVGDFAFRSTRLASIDFSQCTGLTSIGASAFYSCGSLTTVDLSNTNLATIGAAAFYSCGNLATVDLSKVAPTLQSIGSINSSNTYSSGVFANCSKLQTVNLSDCKKLETVGDYAFYYCSQFMDAVDLTNSKSALQKIGSNAFNYSRIISLNLKECTKLETIGNSAFASCTALATADLSGCKELTAISDSTFMSCTNLTAADLSDCTKLETINKQTFSGCTKLDNIDLSDCTALAAIGESAFMTCTSLAAVDLSDCTKLDTINKQAFSGCTKLDNIDLSKCIILKTIGESAFYNCKELDDIDLSKCTVLESIGISAFSSSGLTSFVLKNHTKLKTIGNSAFSNCTYLATVELKGCNEPASASIGTSAFASCGNLEDVKLSGWTGLTSIGSSAFSNSGPASGDTKLSVNMSGCTGLTTITNVFTGCTNIAKVDLSDCTGLTAIAASMLSSRPRLEYVNLSGCKELGTIANSVFSGSGTSIGTAKMKIDMSGCEKLTSIGTSNTISVFTNCAELAILDLSGCIKLTTIATGIFSSRTKLEDVDLSGCTGLASIGNQAFYNCDALTKVNLSGCTSLTSIGTLGTTAANGVFAGCEKLSTVNLASCTNLVTIGDYTFYQCPNLTTNAGMGLDKTGLKTIGKYAFSQSSLTEFVLKNLASLTTIDTYAFASCTSLAAVDLSSCSGLTDIKSSTFSGCILLDTVNLSGCTGLTAIAASMFSGCEALDTVILTGCTGLTSIGSSAFSGCKALATINLSVCTGLTSIDNSAFYNCINLATINLTGCTSLATIGSSAFAYTGLTSFSLHLSSLTSIGGSAFANCANLTNVDLSVCTLLNSIGSSAFAYCATSPSTATLQVNLSGCSALNTITGAFTNCANLAKVDMSNCIVLTAIPANLFSGRTKLTEVKLTGCIKLATIGSSAFYGCTALTNVLTASNLGSVYGSLTTIGASAFRESGVISADLKGCTQPLTIGEYAFANTPLQTLKLPANLTSVGDFAFNPCGSTLSTIYIYITNTGSLNTIFSGGSIFGVKQGFTLHVPTSKTGAYTMLWSNHPGWQLLTTTIEDAN